MVPLEKNKPSSPVDPAALLPPSFLGWTPAETDGRFDADTLFDLIDGGAEVYRSLDVHAVVSRRYAKAGAPDILADVFDMGSSADAFGAYHHDMREGESAGVGRESELLGCCLSFWKDRFFVCLTALDETEETVSALRALAAAVAARIPREGRPPGIAALLPAKNLDHRRVHYFHDHALLERYVALGEGNPLRLNRRTEGVLARYLPAVPGDRRKAPLPSPALIVVRYRDGKEAERAYRSFLARCLPGADREGAARRGKNGWAACRRLGALLALALDARNRESALALVRAVKPPAFEKEPTPNPPHPSPEKNHEGT